MKKTDAAPTTSAAPPTYTQGLAYQGFGSTKIGRAHV